MHVRNGWRADGTAGQGAGAGTICTASDLGPTRVYHERPEDEAICQYVYSILPENKHGTEVTIWILSLYATLNIQKVKHGEKCT